MTSSLPNLTSMHTTSLPHLKKTIQTLQKEVLSKTHEIKEISNEKIILAKRLLEASSLIEGLYEKYEDIRNQKEDLEAKLLQVCKESSQLETDKEFSQEKEVRKIVTQDDSENDEVLIGPDTPVDEDPSLKEINNNSQRKNLKLNSMSSDNYGEAYTSRYAKCTKYEPKMEYSYQKCTIGLSPIKQK